MIFCQFTQESENNLNGPGDTKQRSNASNLRTVYLNAIASLTWDIEIPYYGNYTLVVDYSNDGPDSIDKTIILIDGILLDSFWSLDTRPEGGVQGAGWNVFFQSPELSLGDLAPGTVTLTLQLAEKDVFGIEYDKFTFTSTAFVPSIPTLISPENAAINIGATTTLNWEPSTDAMTYLVEVATTLDFATPIVFSDIISTNQFIDNLADCQTYYWRVKAINGPEQSDWSEVRSFETASCNTPPVIANPIPDQEKLKDFASYIVVNIEEDNIFNDVDGGALNYSVATDGNSAASILANNSLLLEAIAGFIGESEVVVTASDGTSSVNDTFMVNVLDCLLPLDTTLIEISPARCPVEDGKISLPVPNVGTPPFAYSLDGGQTQDSPIFENLAEGSYQILIEDAISRSVSVSVTITCASCPLPGVSINANRVEGSREVSFEANITNGGQVIEWDFGDGNTSTQESPTHTYTQSNNYQVAVVVENECGETMDSLDIEVLAYVFEIGENLTARPGDTIEIPLISRDYEGIIVGVASRVVIDTAVAKPIGFKDGLLPVESSFLAFNQATGQFSMIMSPEGHQINPGDTAFYFVFAIDGEAEAGDSTLIDIGLGNTGLSFTTIEDDDLQLVEATAQTGKIKVINQVVLHLRVETGLGEPVNKIPIQISGLTDNIQIIETDEQGEILLEVKFDDAIVIKNLFDDRMFNGINVLDAAMINRMLVGLTTIGETVHSPLAADFNGEDEVNQIDIIQLLNYIVGNIDFPGERQWLAVPDTHVLDPAEPNYFLVPGTIELSDFDAVDTLSLTLTLVQRGDVDHSNNTIEMRSTIPWEYQQIRTDDFKIVEIFPGHQACSGGQFQLSFNPYDYQLIDIQFPQGKNSSRLVYNKEKLAEGEVNIVFLHEADFDKKDPAVVLYFQANTRITNPLQFSNKASQIVLSEGVISNLALVSRELGLSKRVSKIFPNPADATLNIELPSSEENYQLRIHDLSGKLMLGQQVHQQTSYLLSTVQLPNGLYLLNIKGDKGTIEQKKLVIKH